MMKTVNIYLNNVLVYSWRVDVNYNARDIERLALEILRATDAQADAEFTVEVK